ncbi:hypothetical protein FVEG_16558 [Fusarium verticillioides 7600]|uniref:Uncharacterized protein n=1 Tax=Gibberella moniliformis (strain M3125 / FGSC 7600) TaxID=334819 RepID=W7MEJ5_GIBM7|nr:hypothetical protein FVEG_16558 [Fusarium verticillioides 7600]EWG49983.1 hypothetical protein FVEG_16558 [Fusarium verticillioides 7600]
MPTYWTCRETALDSLDKETVDSIYTDWESKLSTAEFDFDGEVINTRAYRRALAQARAKRSRDLLHKALDIHARVPNAGVLESVEDTIDLTYGSSQQTASVPSDLSSQLYRDLLGLQFIPRNVDGRAHSPESLGSC